MGISIEALRHQFIDLPPELEELYGGRKVKFYYSLEEVRPGIMASHEHAVADLLSRLKTNKSIVVGGFGPMGSGKSTVICVTYERVASAQAFKHVWDLERGGPDITNINCDEGPRMRVPAKHYLRAEDILDQLGPEQLLLVDEMEFAQNTKEEIIAFMGELRRRGHQAFITGLDFTFQRLPWETTQAVLGVADAAFVFAAKCTEPNCSHLAPFTQRTINGEPAHFDDPVVVVGGVVDLYHPKCPDHHQVLPPRGGQ